MPMDADAYIIAVPGAALEDLLKNTANVLDGALVIDATNRLDTARYSQLELFRLHTPAARVARAWCTLGWKNFLEPQINGVTLDLLWCGPDGADGQLVSSLINSSGLHAVRVGSLDCDHILEYQTRLVLSLIFETGRSHKLGFKLLEGPNFS
jgi:predicted dinucleotide-binding enzyme